MGEDEKSKQDDSGNSEKHPQQTTAPASGGNQLMPMPSYGWYSKEEDEIDLADLAGVLFRRKWLIVGLTVLCACLAVAATSRMTKKYNASTMLEIGMLLSDKGFEKVEGSAAVKNRAFSLAKAVAGKMRKEISASGDSQNAGVGFSVNKDLKIEAPENGTIISVNITAPRESKAIDILSRTNNRLIEDHDRIFRQRRAELENRIARKELAVSNIDIQIADTLNRISDLKRRYEEKTGQKENRIKELTHTIQNIESRKNLFREKIKLLQEEKEDLAVRITEAEARYERLINSKLSANDQADSGEAVSLMLFSSEIQHMQNYLAQLRDRLLFGIPENVSELETKIQEFDTQIADIKSEKELEVKRLEQLEPELEEKIEELQGQVKTLESQKDEIRIDVNELKNRLDNMITTQVLVPPEFSDNPASPNMKLNIALGLVAGFFISVFLAFVTEFWQRNKDKIKSGGR